MDGRMAAPDKDGRGAHPCLRTSQLQLAGRFSAKLGRDIAARAGGLAGIAMKRLFFYRKAAEELLGAAAAERPVRCYVGQWHCIP